MRYNLDIDGISDNIYRLRDDKNGGNDYERAFSSAGITISERRTRTLDVTFPSPSSNLFELGYYTSSKPQALPAGHAGWSPMLFGCVAESKMARQSVATILSRCPFDTPPRFIDPQVSKP